MKEDKAVSNPPLTISGTRLLLRAQKAAVYSHALILVNINNDYGGLP